MKWFKSIWKHPLKEITGYVFKSFYRSTDFYKGLRIASLKNENFEDIIEIINESINNMRQDGTYKMLIEKWNLIDPQTQYWQHQEIKSEPLVPSN